MRRLAERCGYTAPTIYHYFGDKKGLFDTLLEERIRQMLRSVRRVRRSPDPVETLLAVAQACVRFGLRNPSQMQLLTALRPDQTDPPQSSVEARELIEGPLRELAQQGRLLVRDTEEAFQCLWIAMHGVMSMLTMRPDYAWSKNLVRTSVAAMLRGLVRPAVRQRPRARGDLVRSHRLLIACLALWLAACKDEAAEAPAGTPVTLQRVTRHRHHGPDRGDRPAAREGEGADRRGGRGPRHRDPDRRGRRRRAGRRGAHDRPRAPRAGARQCARARHRDQRRPARAGARCPANQGAASARRRIADAARPGGDAAQARALAAIRRRSGARDAVAGARRRDREGSLLGAGRGSPGLARRIRGARAEAVRARLARPDRGRVPPERGRFEPREGGQRSRRARRAVSRRDLRRERDHRVADHRFAHAHAAREGAAR